MTRLVTMLPFYVWLTIFIIVPFALIVLYSFTANDGFAATVSNYRDLLDPVYLTVLLKSLWFAVVATFLCFLIGYPVALLLSGERRRDNPVWFVLFIAPMWMNFLLRTYAWMTLLEDTGVINQIFESLGIGRRRLLYNDGALVMGMVYNLLPFMIFPIYTTICKIPRHIIEASRDLGGSGMQTLRRVILPLSVPGIVSGVTMVFVPSVTTFVLSRLLGGGKTPLIGDVIEQQFSVAANWHFGSAVSMIVMAVIIICMWFVNKWNDDEGAGNIIW